MGIEPFEYTCPRVKTPDGTPIRDFIDVEDLVEAHFLAMRHLEKQGKSQILNLGNGKGFFRERNCFGSGKSFWRQDSGEKGRGSRRGIYGNFR
jgi:hypothetical protein